jgi:hypothetical protein
MTGLDAAGTGAEGLDDATLGSLCEHPDRPMTATVVAALSAKDMCRCIQSGWATRPCLRSGQRVQWKSHRRRPLRRR